MNKEKAWALACSAYDAAAEQADEAYGVSIFCASTNSADAEAQFDASMRSARKALDVARFEWQA